MFTAKNADKRGRFQLNHHMYAQFLKRSGVVIASGANRSR
jgi:hypothetical protein